MRPDVGFSIMFTALVAVIVGGAGYLPGAAAGGILVGLLQSLSLWPFSARWQEVTVFVVLIVFLLIRPQGLFGYCHDDPPGLGRWIIFCTSPPSSCCMPVLSLR